MSTTDALTAWLLEALDHEEYFADGLGITDQTQARVAADRKLIEQHGDLHTCLYGETFDSEEPCSVIRLLAWGHRRDNTWGYREEWGPQ